MKLQSAKNIRSLSMALCMVLTIFGMLGCGGDTSSTSPADETGSSGSVGSPAAGSSTTAGAAGVTGVIRFDGPRPERVTLETEGDPKCLVMHQENPLMSEREIVGEDGGIKNVFVYVKNAPDGDYPVPETVAKLDQIACAYYPHVLGVRAGQDIEIRNSDETLHNVRAFAKKNRPFNLGQPIPGVRMKKFDKVEQHIKMKCDVHPWMTAYIFVSDNPFYAVSDESGTYTISGLPAGQYTLVAWHEKYGEQEASITVGDGGSGEANFTFKPEA